MSGPSRRPSWRTAALLVAGVTGVVLAHAADYAVAFPGPAQRARELAASGHGWWPTAAAAAAGAAALAAAMAAARGGAGAVFRRLARPHHASAWADLRGLVAWQALLFSAVEVLERVAADGSPATLLHGHVFVLGLGLQVGVAAAVLLVLRLVERGASAFVAGVLRRRRPATSRPPYVAPLPAAAPPMASWRPCRPRGPPVPLPA